jgi:hypothetical protein
MLKLRFRLKSSAEAEGNALATTSKTASLLDPRPETVNRVRVNPSID